MQCVRWKSLKRSQTSSKKQAIVRKYQSKLRLWIGQSVIFDATANARLVAVGHTGRRGRGAVGVGEKTGTDQVS